MVGFDRSGGYNLFDEMCWASSRGAMITVKPHQSTIHEGRCGLHGLDLGRVEKNELRRFGSRLRAKYTQRKVRGNKELPRHGSFPYLRLSNSSCGSSFPRQERASRLFAKASPCQKHLQSLKSVVQFNAQEAAVHSNSAHSLLAPSHLVGCVARDARHFINMRGAVKVRLMNH